MSESFVRTRLDGELWFVTIARAEKRNALTPQMLEEIAAAVRQADQYPQLRAVIVHAEGPIFSAGIDIMSLGQSRAEVGEGNPARWLRRLAERLQNALFEIESLELPVIGALHGQVLGLGLELAAAFDLRVASADLKLAMPEARMGLVADVGGTTRLCRLIGPSRAKDMLMTCRAVGAEEALGWGLVNRVAPAGDSSPAAAALAAATALAREIAANAPLAVGLGKLLVDQGDGVDRHTQMALERWAQSQLITTGDVVEAMTAFFEKRPPKFQGK
ncbi:MAG: enoyl-CoA hydratase/isomerase family protein [Pirellulales bacterium]